jgi:3-hydroxyisobutyrate dehydrogenase
MIVSILGTGTMGFGMAQVLLRAGFDVRAWNRHLDKAEPLAADGAVIAKTAAEAVDGTEAVLTMLFDADAVLQVMAEAAGALPEGALWLQCSTVGIDGARRIADFARDHGIDVLDAPVLGTKQPASQGKLVVLAAGDPTLRDGAQGVFDAIGTRTVWVGEHLGDASALKLVCNAWVATLMASVGQSMALAEGLGLEPRLFLDAIEGAATDSPYAHAKGELIMGRNYPVAFALDGALKDVRLMLAAAADAKINSELLAALEQTYARASSDGHGEEDMAAVFEAFRGGTDAARRE